MNRKIVSSLKNWSKQIDRKPLIIRGARQVGKTWLVRDLASQLNLDLLELNFERDPQLKTLFEDNNPEKILIRLRSYLSREIVPQNALLFLDEIQAAPELLAKLRWFAEEKPELAVIATGSLLDFALSEHELSMPVGRIQYMYLEPMSFEEFLLVKGEKLYEFLLNYELRERMPAAIHERLWQFLREYILVGGMPAAVDNWVRNQSLSKINEIHQNILATYRDDFSKYAKRVAIERLDEIVRAVPLLVGKKFKYSSVNKDIRFDPLKKALNLLCKARVCHKVLSCAANGIPLDAEIKENIFKVIFLDVGLVSAAMGLSFSDQSIIDSVKLVNEGSIAEQLVGQLLRVIQPFYIDPKLHYWVSEKTNSEAEIDYLIQKDIQIIPVEVKAGKTGTLRSLRTFIKQKGLKKAVRLNADYPNITEVKVKDSFGDLVEYQLISLPLYLAEQINRFL